MPLLELYSRFPEADNPATGEPPALPTGVLPSSDMAGKGLPVLDGNLK
jgi:hypothetical protein